MRGLIKMEMASTTTAAVGPVRG